MIRALLWSLLGVVAVVGAAVAFGGPGQPPTMTSISQPFKGVDFSGVPAVERFTARDGTPLAFRRYAAGAGLGRGSVVLVHGSSATGTSMHPLAQAFQRDGFEVYALDLRGHGQSGERGRIGHIGQLENDIEDFVKAARPAAPRTLIGFSSGGGFVLRFASDSRQALFDSYLLLAPFLSQDAPTQKKNSGGWVSVGIPRIVAVAVLNRLGITLFNDLPVTSFAVADSDRAVLTPQYSFSLAQNFRPRPDYAADIATVRRPAAVLVGQGDEAFHADRFAPVFAAGSPPIPVTVLPNLGHIAITLDPTAHQAAIAAVRQLNLQGNAP